MNNTPYANHTVAPLMTLKASEVSSALGSPFVPTSFVTLDLSDGSDAAKGLKSYICGSNGRQSALIPIDGDVVEFEFDPKYIVIAAGHNPSKDKSSIDASFSGQGDQSSHDTSIEVWGDLINNPDADAGKQVTPELAARHRLVVYSGKWQYGRGQTGRDRPNTPPSERRLELTLSATGVGVPSDYGRRQNQYNQGQGDGEEGGEQNELAGTGAVELPVQKIMRQGLLQIVRNMMDGRVPDENKEANQKFWKDWVTYVRHSRSVQNDLQDEKNGRWKPENADYEDHETNARISAPATDPNANVAEIAAAEAAAKALEAQLATE